MKKPPYTLAFEEAHWSERYLTTSSVGNIIAPLEAGIYYEFQVRGVNTQGAGDWSNAARIWAR